MRGFLMISVGVGILILAYMKLPLVEILTMFFYIVIIPVSLMTAFGLVSAGFLEMMDSGSVRARMDDYLGDYIVNLGTAAGMTREEALKTVAAASPRLKRKATVVRGKPEAKPTPKPTAKPSTKPTAKPTPKPAPVQAANRDEDEEEDEEEVETPVVEKPAPAKKPKFRVGPRRTPAPPPPEPLAPEEEEAEEEVVEAIVEEKPKRIPAMPPETV